MNVKLTHSATARVKLELEVDVQSTWGADCSVAQVHEQAQAAVHNIIRSVITKADVTNSVRVLGVIEVATLIVKSKPEKE